jgi:hypothetical protein
MWAMVRGIKAGGFSNRIGNMKQLTLFKEKYSDKLTVSINRKGVVDVDTVKGCTMGMRAYPNGGCYNACYAKSSASLYGFDFPLSVSRRPIDSERKQIEKTLRDHPASWFRIGTMGDPCHDWPLLVEVCVWLTKMKQPIIITKHWTPIPDNLLQELAKTDCVLNTSVSGIDTDNELTHRIKQHERFQSGGIHSILRLVSCKFGVTDLGSAMAKKQQWIIDYCNGKYIDNPLRISEKDQRVIDGHIIVEKRMDLIKEASMSVLNHDVYTGHCSGCPDQCGTTRKVAKKEKPMQLLLLKEEVKFEYVETVLGSEFQNDIAKLAIEDGVAYRAARKNMQIHSAIVMKVDGTFTGFFTFQVNHDAKEFCLLQSAMAKGQEDKKLYQAMVQQIIDRNTFGYPMVLTCSTKHPLERPSVFEGVGFHTYLELSGYAYMVHGTDDQIRLKRLAHATMTNAWTTTRSDWLKMKREWNVKIVNAGKKHNVANPMFATRDGCWQGSNGMSNVVLSERVVQDDEVKTIKGKSFNGNASVLDPVACEVILRFFMPTEGRRVYNPFGGGVQFGFISGSYGYEYVASEIRQNQCDANNLLCSDFKAATWVQSDSSKYKPDGKFDLCFTCPPYYKVEKYIDYDGVIPDGELNNMPTYAEFRDLLFSGYKNAIEALADDRFFVVMTGDSRDKNGAYYGCEAEHELFFRDQGLYIYNKIVYLECEFTRLAHAKRTLDYRKFPKREQKILVFYKGDMKKIKSLFPSVGRL